MVGLSSLASSNKDNDGELLGKQTNALGIILLGFSMIFNGFQFIIEEAILDRYITHPLKIVGFEGLWGMLIYTLSLIIMQNIDCTYWSVRRDLCSENSLGEWKLEDTLFALRQIGSNGVLFFYVFGVTFTIAFFNYCGVCILK